MDPNGPVFAQVAEEGRQNNVIGVSIAMTVCATLVVGLRVFTRSMIVGRMFLDDWAMVITMFFAYAFLLELLLSIKNFNAGFSGAQLNPNDMTGILKLTVAIIVTYKALLTSIRTSILFFYLRLAVERTFEKMCKWTFGFVILFFVVFASVTIGQCVPLHKLWDFTGAVQGKCIDTNAFYHVGTVIQILLDIWILVLPYKLVTRIKRPWHEMGALVFIFGLGALSVVAAIARLAFLHIFTASKDPFADIIPIHIWSMVETNLAIICACLPTLKPLFSKSQRNRTREVNGYLSNNKSENTGTVENTANLSIKANWSMKTETVTETEMTAQVRESYRPPVPPKSSHSPKSSRSQRDFDLTLEGLRAARRIEAQFV
ncbi:hypothetical protein BCR34DRAFT_582546 [Clohesyomyces aquaticus]|uniref:Rhodopsin domain-containing protein n=1 Tax=Clohesyomyces aquaticus TaxID=1231657 RepID=A0A1Y2A901_9PLEO|nr:hypothetical protein BCR34DRAFT_582546 [Clohesyomyces aquaticus]